MFEGKKSKEKSKINYLRLNEVLRLSHHVLKIFYILVCIICVYAAIKIFQELHILKFILDILGILSPLFVGVIIAWIFNPFITFLQKKGVKRIFGIMIVYIIFLGIVALIVGSILPILYDQIISFADTIPNLVDSSEKFLNGLLNHFSNINGFNIDNIKNGVIGQLETFGSNLSQDLPTNIINFLSALVSGISTFVVGLVIGFFLLLKSNNAGEVVTGIVPKKWRAEFTKLTDTINNTLRRYLVGVVIDAFVIFIICSLAFSLVGLRAPLLFAVFCAITNVIPFVGPYIGAVPAVIVGFTISPTVGILTIVAIAIIQFFEGNFLQEVIMSKTTKLHPVTIITGLLIFGHFWGIIGMVVSTPIIGIIKQIWLFLDEKYDFFGIEEES